MTSRKLMGSVLAVALAVVACDPSSVDPLHSLTFDKGGVGRPVVLVNPNVQGSGTATTIQEGIDMVAEGGRVMVLPGTYEESIVIDKGLTLEGIGGESGPVVIEQVRTAPPNPAGRSAVIKVATTEAVVIRGIGVHHVGLRGVNNFTETSAPFPVNLTIDHASFAGEYPFATVGAAYGVSVVNNAAQSGGRAHLEVRNSSIHVNRQSISLGGDVDALIDHNSLSATSACVRVSPVGQTVTVPAGAAIVANIVDNEMTDCGGANPGTRAINVQDVTGATTVGTVNIVGNTLRTTSTSATACTEAAIAYEFASGVIEHNSIVAAVPSCGSVGQGRGGPGAIRVGGAVTGTRPAAVMVRFNDIAGNAFAGLWVGRNQTTALDATCNWWGSATGPSGLGSGAGDAIVKEAPAAAPTFTPFATAPIAATDATGC